MIQEEKITHIYYVFGKLSKDGFTHRVKRMECEEKKKIFITASKRIAKTKVMNLQTMVILNHKYLSYYTYCLEGEQQKALDMIKTKIIEDVKAIKSDLDLLLRHI